MPLPFSSGGNSAVNSLKVPSSLPRSSWWQLSSTERMACVAHALLMTWLAKKTCGTSRATGLSSFSCRHLNKKMRPYTGLRAHRTRQCSVPPC
jgi:hypothetical protein